MFSYKMIKHDNQLVSLHIYKDDKFYNEAQGEDIPFVLTPRDEVKEYKYEITKIMGEALDYFLDKGEKERLLTRGDTKSFREKIYKNEFDHSGIRLMTYMLFDYILDNKEKYEYIFSICRMTAAHTYSDFSKFKGA